MSVNAEEVRKRVAAAALAAAKARAAARDAALTGSSQPKPSAPLTPPSEGAPR